MRKSRKIDVLGQSRVLLRSVLVAPFRSGHQSAYTVVPASISTGHDAEQSDSPHPDPATPSGKLNASALAFGLLCDTNYCLH
jgi:hypothetical protein